MQKADAGEGRLNCAVYLGAFGTLLIALLGGGNFFEKKNKRKTKTCNHRIFSIGPK